MKSSNQPIFIQYVKERVLVHNKNFVLGIFGPTGSGKTYGGLTLAKKIDPTFSIERVCFSAKEFMNTINDLVDRSEKGEDIRGKVILWDEMGVGNDSRTFMSIQNRVMSYFFQTSRHLNLCVITTVPVFSMIDANTRKLMHCLAETESINRTKKQITFKLKMIQTNTVTGKIYLKYMRYIKNGKQYVFKKLKVGMPDKKLVEDYEKKKREFTKALNKDIMSKLEAVEARERGTLKRQLTEKQEEVMNMLSEMSVDEVCDKLSIKKGSVYGYKTAIEKKGVTFQPIKEGNRIIKYKIGGTGS